MIVVREYVDENGTSPYAKWFDSLNAPAAAKVAIAITRMAQDNLSNIKGIGAGVHEYRILGRATASILARMVTAL